MASAGRAGAWGSRAAAALAACGLLAVAAGGCGAQPRSITARDCGDSYVEALTRGDGLGMYECTSGRLRHQIDERADSNDRRPAAELQHEIGARTYNATGRFRVVRRARLGPEYQAMDLVESREYEVATSSGWWRLLVLLDHGGRVGEARGPLPAGA